MVFRNNEECSDEEKINALKHSPNLNVLRFEGRWENQKNDGCDEKNVEKIVKIAMNHCPNIKDVHLRYGFT